MSQSHTNRKFCYIAYDVIPFICVEYRLQGHMTSMISAGEVKKRKFPVHG